jgi:hypothetical protein
MKRRRRFERLWWTGCNLSIWRCDHNCVAVEIPDPNFKVPSVWIDVTFAHDGDLELTSSDYYLLEVVHFEPEQNPVADRVGWVAYRTMMMIGVPVVQLQH